MDTKQRAKADSAIVSPRLPVEVSGPDPRQCVHSIAVVSHVVDYILDQVAAIEFDKALQPMIPAHASKDTLSILQCHAELQELFALRCNDQISYDYKAECEEPMPAAWGDRSLKLNIKPAPEFDDNFEAEMIS
jgi:hypothetical protein